MEATPDGQEVPPQRIATLTDGSPHTSPLDIISHTTSRTFLNATEINKRSGPNPPIIRAAGAAATATNMSIATATMSGQEGTFLKLARDHNPEITWHLSDRVCINNVAITDASEDVTLVAAHSHSLIVISRISTQVLQAETHEFPIDPKEGNILSVHWLPDASGHTLAVITERSTTILRNANRPGEGLDFVITTLHINPFSSPPRATAIAFNPPTIALLFADNTHPRGTVQHGTVYSINPYTGTTHIAHTSWPAAASPVGIQPHPPFGVTAVSRTDAYIHGKWAGSFPNKGIPYLAAAPDSGQPALAVATLTDEHVACTRVVKFVSQADNSTPQENPTPETTTQESTNPETTPQETPKPDSTPQEPPNSETTIVLAPNSDAHTYIVPDIIHNIHIIAGRELAVRQTDPLPHQPVKL